jgi:copper chaperone CopZ
MRREALALLAAIAVKGLSRAEGTSDVTVMTVSEMCGGCVKKITARLEKMDGLASISCDIKTKTVTVTPKAGVSLSAKTLWTEMEAIGKTPKKLIGPSGTFISKPQS